MKITMVDIRNEDGSLVDLKIFTSKGEAEEYAYYINKSNTGFVAQLSTKDTEKKAEGGWLL